MMRKIKKVRIGILPPPEIRNKQAWEIREIWIKSGWGAPNSLKSAMWRYSPSFNKIIH